jgi:hypothetical protein
MKRQLLKQYFSFYKLRSVTESIRKVQEIEYIYIYKFDTLRYKLKYDIGQKLKFQDM